MWGLIKWSIIQEDGRNFITANNAHKEGYSQLNGFVPVDNVTWQLERFNVNHMDIAPLSAYIQPLALEGKLTMCYPVQTSQIQQIRDIYGICRMISGKDQLRNWVTPET